MQSRYNIDSDFNQWFDSVKNLEINKSLKKIKNGQDIDSVLEEYAHAINKCLLHAVFINIKQAAIRPYDAQACRKQYFDNTPKNYQQAADHILE